MVQKIITEFSRKNWSFFLHEIDLTGSADCDVDRLKEQLVEEWQNWQHFDQRIVDRAVCQRRQRLHSCRLSVRLDDTLNIQLRRPS